MKPNGRAYGSPDYRGRLVPPGAWEPREKQSLWYLAGDPTGPCGAVVGWKDPDDRKVGVRRRSGDPQARGIGRARSRRRNGENTGIARNLFGDKGLIFTGPAGSKIGGNAESRLRPRPVPRFLDFLRFSPDRPPAKIAGRKRPFRRGFRYLGCGGRIFSVFCAAPSGNISQAGGRTFTSSPSRPVGFHAFGGRPRPAGAGSARSRNPLSSSSAR